MDGERPTIEVVNEARGASSKRLDRKALAITLSVIAGVVLLIGAHSCGRTAERNATLKHASFGTCLERSKDGKTCLKPYHNAGFVRHKGYWTFVLACTGKHLRLIPTSLTTKDIEKVRAKARVGDK